jgi:hypothetical protein
MARLFVLFSVEGWSGPSTPCLDASTSRYRASATSSLPVQWIDMQTVCGTVLLVSCKLTELKRHITLYFPIFKIGLADFDRQPWNNSGSEL